MLNHARSLRGLLLLSGLILTVHTLVPHVHGAHFPGQGEVSIVPDLKAPTGWFDLLTDLVDADMGEDHLEHFSSEKAIDFALAVPAITAYPPPALFAERFLFSPDTAVKVAGRAYAPGPEIMEVYLLGTDLRGPPALV